MDQVVGQALAMFNRIAESEKTDTGLARAARGMAEINGAAGAKVALGYSGLNMRRVTPLEK
jgi:hypothetical protein